TLSLYAIFNTSRDFSFRDQICRASISIMNNIAEGFERDSDKEFKHFLFMAKGSSGEVRSMLQVAVELSYISNNEYIELLKLSNDISKLLAGLIKSLG
ncbi:MAG: four helix bundle protein, partial [Bacteroidales bacterium]|nr:four helix bundle protein [Bacteroidales bacterium]